MHQQLLTPLQAKSFARGLHLKISVGEARTCKAAFRHVNLRGPYHRESAMNFRLLMNF
jgi:hypothetical protein